MKRNSRRNRPLPGERRGRLARLAAIGLPLSAVLGCAGQFLLSFRGEAPLPGIALGSALYVAALVMLIGSLVSRRAGGGPGEAAPAGEESMGRLRTLPPRLEWGLVALLVLGGLFLRLYQIDLIPWGLNNDEAINAIEASEIREGKPVSTLTERGLHRETMFHYLAAASFRFPGLSGGLPRRLPGLFSLQPTRLREPMIEWILPLRGVAIAAGTLTILALYLLGRWRYGWRVAFLAALFLSVSPWHLLYSRVGLRAVLAPLFAIAAVAMFIKARESGRLLDHLGWGMILGIGCWTYTSFRAVPLAFLAVFLLRPLLRRSAPGALRKEIPSAALGGGVAAILLVVLFSLSGLPLSRFLSRGAYAALPPASNGMANLFHSLTMLNYYPARYAVIQSDEFHSDGVSTTFGSIGLEPDSIVLASLATLGLVYLIWSAASRRRDPDSALLALCILSLLLTVGWMGPSLTRMLLNLPWLCLCASLFAWRLFDEVAAWKRPYTIWIAGAVIAGLGSLGCAQGFSNYFLSAGRSERAMENFGAAQTIMGHFVRAMPPGPMVYVLHTLRVDSLRYLIGDRPDVELVSDPSTLDLERIGKLPRTVSFVIEYAPRFAEPMRSLIMRFPQGEATQVADARLDPDQVIFYTFTIWKDAAGRPIPPPGAPPPLPAPGGMSFPRPEPSAAPPPGE